MRKHWTTGEEANVRAVHASGMPYAQMMHLWPGRTHQSVICHAAEMGLGERPVPLRKDISLVWPKVLEEVKKGPIDAYQIADRLGITRKWSRRLLRDNLESEKPAVQVVRWTRSGGRGPYREVWALGNGEIAEQPMKLTRIERNRLARLAEKSATSPFSVAAGLASVPIQRHGRVFQQSMRLKDFDDELEAA